MFNDVISRVVEEYAKKYDERCYEILDGYFGMLPRDINKLGLWFQEKRNQGYSITVGQDMKDIFKFNNQVHFLTIKYDKEIVLKEVVIVVNMNFMLKESDKDD